MYKLKTGMAIIGLILATMGTAVAADTEVPTDFATIQAAIDDPGTGAGDTITVTSAIHQETNIHVTKAVTIEGLGIGTTSIKSPTPGSGIGFFVDTDNVTLKKMTIESHSQGVRFYIPAGTVDNTDFVNVEFLNNSSRGIEVHNTTTVTNLLINNCLFTTTNIGIRVSSSGHLHGVEFRGSIFDGGTIGIYEANDGGTSTMKDVLVTGCLFKDIASGQGTAIFLEEIQDASIIGNTFLDNRRDIQIFKWYQASVPVSNVTISGNTMTGTTNAVFALFNAEHSSGRTKFDGISITDNKVNSSDGSALFAGAHSSSSGLGGTGWDTVKVSCNAFEGITSPGNGVRFFTPGQPLTQALGGASVDVSDNWWGTTDEVAITQLMQEPSITEYLPILDLPNGCLYPKVSTYAAKQVDCHSAVLRGGIVAMGGSPVQYRFHYGVVGGPMQTTPWANAPAVRVFTTRLHNLLRDTEYVFQAELRNNTGATISHGPRTFRTLKGEIIWVSETADVDADDIQDDQGFVDLLTEAGYCVDVRLDNWTALEGRDEGDANDYVAELNATDLVIVSSTIHPDQYDDGNEPTLWNGLTVPLIQLSNGLLGSSHWSWINSTALANSNQGAMTVLDPAHSIFDGIGIDMNSLVPTANPDAYPPETGYQGLGFIVHGDIGNGILLGQNQEGHPWVAEWDAGTAFFPNADQSAGGERLMFIAGTQEEAGLVPRGGLSLTESGEALFLNAVGYIIDK